MIQAMMIHQATCQVPMEIKPKKRPERKRKSHSSASEMLEFMNRYAEKREKAEEEKLNLMREMQNEKKMFFSQYLEIMGNK